MQGKIEVNRRFIAFFECVLSASMAKNGVNHPYTVRPLRLCGEKLKMRHEKFSALRVTNYKR